MNDPKPRTSQGYRLDPPGDPLGVSCGVDGLTIGSVALLTKTESGLVPRSVFELDFVFSRVFATPLDCSELLPGLRAVARALNEGDLSRGMIAAQLMRLPRLNENEARRATAAENLLKASPNDPKHPGWPAGAPDSQGGKYREKEVAGDIPDDEGRIEFAEKRMQNSSIRAAFRTGVAMMLNPRRVARLAGDALSNFVPVLDVAGDAQAVYELATILGDVKTLQVETKAALEFAERGPRTLDELRVSGADESFRDMAAFTKDEVEKRFGPAPPGYEYHHIVEQSSGDLPAELLHSTRNVIAIPKLLHEEVTSISAGMMTTTTTRGRVVVRKWLKTQPYELRYKVGLMALREIGILK